jgi:cyclophilin family peptidyl-prolyl cis-trans isomerase
VPTEKRQRQKEGRQARLAAKRKAEQRRSLIRRISIIIVVAVVVALSAYWIWGRNSSTTTTTTTTTTTIPTKFNAPQAALNAVAANAGCPRSPTTPANTLHWSSIPKLTINAAASYSAVFKTDVGSFTVALNPKLAPETVNNFVFLARKGYYNCGALFRVIPGFAAQGGNPAQSTATGTQPGYTIPDENMKNNFVGGDLVMANTGQPNSGGSQFFLVPKTETIQGQYGYSLFGKVTSGLRVVEVIVDNGNPSVNAGGVPPYLTHRVISITIEGPG